MKKLKVNNGNLLMILPLMLAFVLFGGFYSFGAYFAGAVILFCLFLRLGYSKRSFSPDRIVIGICVGMFGSAFISCLVSINKGLSWLGLIRLIGIFLWAFFLFQFEESERDAVLHIFPFVGVGMVLIGVVAYWIPDLKEFFWQSGRLGGIFQYSNTCGLFLLICVVLLTAHSHPAKRDFILFDSLLFGVFLTGSKGSVILLILVLLWIFLKKKAFRKNIGIFLVVMLIVAFVYGVLTKDYQNIARIFTLLKNPSTLYGRVLYVKDVIPTLIQNPLGIGYMGYASIQSSIQTGVYTTIYLHNDWIQMALDFGWIFSSITVFVFLFQIIKGRQSAEKKMILVIIAVYSLLEFHFQYFFMDMLVLLFFDMDRQKAKIGKGLTVKENQIFSIVGCFFFLYLGMASFCTYIGEYDRAVSMNPLDTQARTGQLLEEAEKDTAVTYATKLLEHDTYNIQAYNALAYAALMDGNVEHALDNKMKILEIARFDMNEYADFDEMVQNILSATDDSQIQSLCKSARKRMQSLLSETKENVSPMAYKLRDKPVFIWE